MKKVYLVDSQIQGPLGIYSTEEKAIAASINQFAKEVTYPTPAEIRKIVNEKGLTIKTWKVISRGKTSLGMRSVTKSPKVVKATPTNIKKALKSRVGDGSVTISGGDTDSKSGHGDQIAISVFQLDTPRR